MAVNHNFRSALSGFNREDVVHYIEYLNAKNTAAVNQLTCENEELKGKLARLAELEALETRCAQLEEELAQAQAHSAELARQLEEMTPAQEPAQEEAPAPDIKEQELEAYRRAERAEREARDRAEQIYRQAVGTLAQATSQVDGAADRVRQVTERIAGQMSELQAAVELSRAALVDAATTMYSIRPEDME